MSGAIAGIGAIFQRWDSTLNSSAGGWVKLANINNISGPGMSRDTIDVSTLDTVGGYREFITGFRNPGTMTLEMNFTATDYTILKNDFELDTAQNYRVILPDATHTSFEFEGLVTELPLTIPPDNKITVNVTIQISGQVVMGTASSGTY